MIDCFRAAPGCYGSFGCFSVARPFTSSIRPINNFPEAPEIILPAYCLYTRHNRSRCQVHYIILSISFFSGVAATRRQKNFRNMAPKFCSLWFTTVANNVKRNLCRVPFPLAPNLAGISNILFLSLSLYTESGDGRFQFDPPQRTGSHPANFVYCSRLSWARQQEMDQGSISHSLQFVVTLYTFCGLCI